ncbi:MAG: hypothetical protein HFJ45_02950 [Clostridia bacterium]|nr:hypothetical protein [Clostridia bacterium]
MNLKETFGQVLRYKISEKDVVVIGNINKYTLKKLDKIFKVDVIKNVCVCDELMRNQEFLDYLKNKKLKIVDGRWLFKFMFLDIVEYICKQTGKKLETQEISILVHENNLLISQSIKRLSEKVKNINVITNNINSFKMLEKSIYEEKGLIINITNNLKKSLQKSNIIFNLNFSQEEFDKVYFPQNAVIVNFEGETKMKQKSFNGINSNFFNINLPLKYKEIYNKLNRFNSVNLYESLIYRNTQAENIWREIKEDKIEVLSLEGRNGMIRFPK